MWYSILIALNLVSQSTKNSVTLRYISWELSNGMQIVTSKFIMASYRLNYRQVTFYTAVKSTMKPWHTRVFCNINVKGIANFKSQSYCSCFYALLVTDYNVVNVSMCRSGYLSNFVHILLGGVAWCYYFEKRLEVKRVWLGKVNI